MAGVPFYLGTGRGQVRREEPAVYWGVSPTHFPFCIYQARVQCSQGCLRGILGSPAWECWGLNLSPQPCFFCCVLSS